MKKFDFNKVPCYQISVILLRYLRLSGGSVRLTPEGGLPRRREARFIPCERRLWRTLFPDVELEEVYPGVGGGAAAPIFLPPALRSLLCAGYLRRRRGSLFLTAPGRRQAAEPGAGLYRALFQAMTEAPGVLSLRGYYSFLLALLRRSDAGLSVAAFLKALTARHPEVCRDFAVPALSRETRTVGEQHLGSLDPVYEMAYSIHRYFLAGYAVPLGLAEPLHDPEDSILLFKATALARCCFLEQE